MAWVGIHQAEVLKGAEGIWRPNSHYIFMLPGNLTDVHGFRLQVLYFKVRSITMCPLQIFQGKTLISSRTKRHTLRLIMHYLYYSLFPNFFFLSREESLAFRAKKMCAIKCEYHYIKLTEKEQVIMYYREDQHHECNIQRWITLILHDESSSCLLKAFKSQVLICVWIFTWKEFATLFTIISTKDLNITLKATINW